MADLIRHFTLLRHRAPISPTIRLGQPITSRTKSDPAAMKVASKDTTMSQLLNEVRFLLNLDHKAIVRAYGIYAVKDNGTTSLGMVLDFKSGGDLASYVPSGEGLPEFVVRCIAVQLCDALTYLHEIPVVHRDIKLSNVLCERAKDD